MLGVNRSIRLASVGVPENYPQLTDSRLGKKKRKKKDVLWEKWKKAIERHKHPVDTAVYHKIRSSQNNRQRLSEGRREDATESCVTELDLTPLTPTHSRTHAQMKPVSQRSLPLLLPQAGGVSPPLIPPGTHR